MNARTFYFLAAACVIAGAFAWRTHTRREHTVTSAALAAIVSESARLEKQVRAAEQRLARAEEETVRLAAARARTAAEPGPAALPNAAPKPPRSQKELLAEDPKLQALWQRSERATLTRRHTGLFQELGLSSEQKERFLDLAMKQREAGPDRMQRRKAEEDFRAGLKDLLEPAAFAQWEEFERTAPVRVLVEKLASEAALAGAAVTPQQASRLTAALASAAPRRPNGAVNADAIDWNAVATRVPGILSDAQAALFASIAAEAQAAAHFHRAFSTVTEGARNGPR